MSSHQSVAGAGGGAFARRRSGLGRLCRRGCGRVAAGALAARAAFGGAPGGFRGRLLRQLLRPQFLLHALDQRGELHDALLQHVRLGFDRGRLLLLRLFAVGHGGGPTGAVPARRSTPKAAAARRRRPAGASARPSRRRGPSCGAALRVGLGAVGAVAGGGARCASSARGARRAGAWLRAPAGAGGGATTASRGAASAATTGASIAGGSMNSVYSRRIVASQPAWIVSRTIGSFTGRALVMTSAVPAGERSTLTRPNSTCGMPSASRSAAAILKHSDGEILAGTERDRHDDPQRLAERGLLRDRARGPRPTPDAARAPPASRRDASGAPGRRGAGARLRTSGRAGRDRVMESNRWPARFATAPPMAARTVPNS